MTADLDGRVALVTGGGRNLGRSIATALAEAGAKVAITVRSNIAEGHEVVAALRELGTDALLLVGDVGDASEDARMVDEAVSALGRVEILVNNAAIRPRQPLLSIDPNDWDAVLRNNLSSLFYLSRLVLDGMSAGGFGRVINIGGPDGNTGYPNRAHNVTCKAGLVGLTKAIAREFGPYGVTANVVVPGMMDTTRDPVDYPDWPPSQEMLEQQLCIPRLGRAEEVAHACVFLAGEWASYITGQTLHVSGGMVMP